VSSTAEGDVTGSGAPDLPEFLQMAQIGADIAAEAAVDDHVKVLAQLSSGSLNQGLYLDEEKLIEQENDFSTEDKEEVSKAAATSVAEKLDQNSGEKTPDSETKEKTGGDNDGKV